MRERSGRAGHVIVLVAAASLIAAACTGGVSSPTATTAAPPAATAAPTATAAPPAAYRATIRPAKENWVLAHGNGYGGIDFTNKIVKSMSDTAAKMGVTIIECDNKADQQATLTCADTFITRKVDGVMFANWLPELAPVLSEKFTGANIPMVTYDGPHPGAVAFGGDNRTAGRLVCEYMGEYAKAQGWDPNETWLVMGGIIAQQVITDRLAGCRDGIDATFPVPSSQISEIAAEKPAETLTNMTDWLTAHPNAKHVIAFGHSDQPGVELGAALEAAGRLETSIAGGTGASEEGLVDLRTRTDETSVYRVTVSYFPERYGAYLVPILVDLIEGIDVPDNVFIDHEIITRANVSELYPAS